MKFQDSAKKFTLKELPNSEVELSGDVAPEVIEPFKQDALKHITAEMEMPGFRRGHVPADMVIQKVGEISLLEEAVELFIQEFYPELVEVHKIDAVGRPAISINKLAPGNPVGLVIRAAIYPKLELPKDWKTIGKNIVLEASLPATDEELNQTLEQLRQSRKKDDKVPELTDEFAQSIGAFKNIDELKEQIKKGIGEEKERASRDKRRGKIVDELLSKVEVDVPGIFIDSELEKIISQLKEDVARFGLNFEQYLEQIKKSEADIRSELRDQARKRAKLQLTLNKIAEEEKIEPDKTAVDAEMQHAISHFPDANPELVRVHIETVLRNEQALKLLEAETK